MEPALNTFFRKTVLFLAAPIGLLLLALLALDRSNRSFFDGFKVAPKVTTLYAGDSHIEQCINDKLMARSLSIAQTAEALYFSYFKIEKLLENNPSIDTLFLGFSYHSLSDYYDGFVFGEDSPHLAARYFFILPNSEKAKFLLHNSDNLALFLKNILRDGKDKAFLGGFENGFPNTAASQKSMDKRIAFQYFKNGKLNGFSELNLASLDKIAQLCREKKVELVLLNTPLHPYYKSKVPAEYLQKYESVIHDRQLKVVAFEGLELADSCFIPDGDHVSERGAILATKYMEDFGKTMDNKKPVAQ